MTIFRMCRCCQMCWEDFYWSCIEEKFCYDENIANYNPDEDDYYTKKSSNGFVTSNGVEEAGDNNNELVLRQPGRLDRHISVNSHKVHEEDYSREVQTNANIIAPEIINVFRNSQIFHEHKPLKVKPAPEQPATFTIGTSKLDNLDKENKDKSSQDDAAKLLQRLDAGKSIDVQKVSHKRSPSLPKIITSSIIEEEDEVDKDGVVLRPKHLQHSQENVWPTLIVNKNLRHLNVGDANFFQHRPASENDIFTISKEAQNEDRNRMSSMVASTSHVNRISMTPEVPSISFAHLPKNYLETPTIEKYKESTSLYSIQTAEIRQSMVEDLTMPRYYRKSELILTKSFDHIEGSNTSIASTSSQPKKQVEKSKRLKLHRTTLAPLMIDSKEKSEKEK